MFGSASDVCIWAASLQYCSREEKKYKRVFLFIHITKICSKLENQSTAFSPHHLIILAWCSSLPSMASRVLHNYDHSKKKKKHTKNSPHHAPFPKFCWAFLNFMTICHFSSYFLWPSVRKGKLTIKIFSKIEQNSKNLYSELNNYIRTVT